MNTSIFYWHMASLYETIELQYLFDNESTIYMIAPFVK